MADDYGYEDPEYLEILGPERVRQLLMTLRGAPPEFQRAAVMQEAQQEASRRPGMDLLQQARPDAFAQTDVAAAPGIRGEAGGYGYGGPQAPPSTPAYQPPPPPGVPPQQMEQAKKGFLEGIDWKQIIGFLGSVGMMASNRPGIRQAGSMSLADDYNTKQAELAFQREQQLYQQRLGAQQRQEQWKATLKQEQDAAKARADREQLTEAWGLVKTVADRGGRIQEAIALGAPLGIKPDDVRQMWGEIREQAKYEEGALHIDPNTGFAVRFKPGGKPPEKVGQFPRSGEVKGAGENLVVQPAPGREVSDAPAIPGYEPAVTVEGQLVYRPQPKPEKDVNIGEEADRIHIAEYGVPFMRGTQETQKRVNAIVAQGQRDRAPKMSIQAELYEKSAHKTLADEPEGAQWAKLNKEGNIERPTSVLTTRQQAEQQGFGRKSKAQVEAAQSMEELQSLATASFKEISPLLASAKNPGANLVTYLGARSAQFFGADGLSNRVDALKGNVLRYAKTFQGAAAQLSNNDVAAVEGMRITDRDTVESARTKTRILLELSQTMKRIAMGEAAAMSFKQQLRSLGYGGEDTEGGGAGGGVQWRRVR